MQLMPYHRLIPVAIGLALIAITLPGRALADVPIPRERPMVAESRQSAPQARSFAPVVSDEDAAKTREALEHVFAGRFTDALDVQRELTDPLAVNLVEFSYIREAGSQVPYQRIARFLQTNPDWPAREQIRRLYEVALLVQRADTDAILAAFSSNEPLTNPGVILYATALAERHDVGRAAEMVRELWRTGQLTEGEEQLIRRRFGEYITREDLRYRMERLLYAGNHAAALRVARELGDDFVKLAEARRAVIQNASDAEASLDTVPEELRDNAVYRLSLIQHTRRSGENIAAAKMLLDAPRGEDSVDPDAWSTERRIAARTLVEAGKPESAYKVIANHATSSAAERLNAGWHAGWVALRFLEDPETAATHFAPLRDVATRPISRARVDYWLGRAKEAAGDREAASVYYAHAAEHATTYYGQLALDRIAREDMAPARKPLHADAALRLIQDREPLRAIRLLKQAGYDQRIPRLLISLAQSADDGVMLVGLAEFAHIHGYASAAVAIGKQGTYAGEPTEAYAFNQLGIPDFEAPGPAAEHALVYAIARQESLFNPGAVSSAGAMGLLQLMPATARQTAQTYGLSYTQSRLTQDPVYNAKLGSAYLGELVAEFGRAYPLVFAAYNAGRSRVYQWLERFGDPRTGDVDPVDWVEMIPFAETRNYVQRVMEGVQVYRASLEGSGPLLIARDLMIREDDRGDIHIASDDGSDGSPFGAISETDMPEAEEPTRGLGFAPGRQAVTSGFGGSGASSSGFGFGGF